MIFCMRLLIITQAVDLKDANLGFFHEWIKEFAKRVSVVEVIALRVGEHNLPENVSVHRIFGSNKLSRFIRMAGLLRQLLPQSDRVFVHMAPIYAILASPFAWWYRKPVILWYVHKHVDLKLRIAEKLVSAVASTSPESFRLPSRKVLFLGHGIDVDLFALPATAPAGFAMLTAGRLSRLKRIDILLQAVSAASNQLPSDWRFNIVGSPITADDVRYQHELTDLAQSLGIADHVSFAGGVPHSQMPAHYQSAHLFLHASATGSIDKAVLEAMSTGLPLITSSEAFRSILPEEYIVKTASVESFASMIVGLETQGRDIRLRNIVREKFELSDLIRKLVIQLTALSVPID